jgi:hypothetical protein
MTNKPEKQPVPFVYATDEDLFTDDLAPVPQPNLKPIRQLTQEEIARFLGDDEDGL